MNFVGMKWFCMVMVLMVVAEAGAWQRPQERTWYVNGKPVKATGYSLNGDKVHLQTLQDWPEPRVVFIGDLSPADREYIKSGTQSAKKQDVRPPLCPMLNVKASVDLGSKTSKGQGVAVQVRVEPPGGRPCGGKVEMKVLLVGKESGSSHYVVVGSKAFPFRLPEEESLPLDFKFNLGKPKGAKSALRYAGYLVAVSDENGRRVALEGYPGSFAKNAEKVLVLSEGDRFDQRFNLVPEE